MRKPELSGAFGVVRPPTRAMIAHPERVRRFLAVTRLFWAVRLGTIGLGLYLLYAAHLLVV